MATARRLLLIHGWPEAWYAWRLIMPRLAQEFEVIAVDQRGTGLSDKPADGYDTATLANDMVALMDALGHERFSVVGHDVGTAIAYALAADHHDRVERLVLAEAPRSANVDEQPSRGGEDRYVGHAFAEATVKTLPAYAIRHYVDTIAVNAAGVRGSFGFYRELDTTLAQNQRRAAHPPALPILAVGGAASGCGSVAGALHLAGDDVHSLIIAGAGHYLAEEAPDELLAALTSFLSTRQQ